MTASSLIFGNRLLGGVYELLTSQDLWRRHAAGLLAHAGPLAGAPPHTVLDLGCGPGESTFVLAELLGPDTRVHGIDRSPAMVRRALARAEQLPSTTNHAEVTFAVADARELSLETASVDLVVGHSFLYLVPPADRDRVLAETVRVLEPGGRLVLMEPSADGSLRTALGHHWRTRGTDPGPRARPWTTTRFAASLLLWRMVSGVAGRPDARELHRRFGTAGYIDVSVVPTLGGLGLFAAGTRHRACYTADQDPGRT